jgi:hypothetical protein
MATTTNYNWTTPDDTDLVKDGAAAIRTLGSSIDTSLVNLLGGTTGQVLTKSSGTDLDFAFATPAAGGGMTLLSTTTLSGASTTVSSISGAYKSLVGYIYRINLSSNDYPMLKPNGVNSTGYSGTVSGTATAAANDWLLSTGSKQMAAASLNNAFTFKIDNYANTTNYKPMQWYGFFSGTADDERVHCGGAFKSNSAMTSLTITTNSGSTTYDAGTLLLYGVN